jgi:hypothetical protein
LTENPSGRLGLGIEKTIEEDRGKSCNGVRETLPAFRPGLVLAARGRARSRRNASMRARIIGKSSAVQGRVTFPPFSCDCPITPLGDRARAIVLEFADPQVHWQDTTS